MRRSFDPAVVPSGHFGVAIMRERAETVGAAVEVESQPGQGTCVRLSWRDLSVARPSPEASEVLV